MTLNYRDKNTDYKINKEYTVKEERKMFFSLISLPFDSICNDCGINIFRPKLGFCLWYPSICQFSAIYTWLFRILGGTCNTSKKKKLNFQTS